MCTCFANRNFVQQKIVFVAVVVMVRFTEFITKMACMLEKNYMLDYYQDTLTYQMKN